MGGFKGTDAEEWKVGAAARRDERHTRAEPAPNRPARARPKDTRRWCGGVVGRAHQLAVGRLAEVKGWGRMRGRNNKVLFCAACGRDLRPLLRALGSQAGVARMSGEEHRRMKPWRQPSPCCGARRGYNDKHDAYFCDKCFAWLEPVCNCRPEDDCPYSEHAVGPRPETARGLP
jgi:hypothetical protein